MSAYSDYACGAMSYEEFKSTVAWEAAKERADVLCNENFDAYVGKEIVSLELLEQLKEQE